MSIHFDAAIYIQSLPCNVVSVRRAQKRDRCGKIGRRTRPLERNALGRLLAPFTLAQPKTGSLGLVDILPPRNHSHTGAYPIYIDIARSQLDSCPLRDADPGPMCRGVMGR